jgi:predicted metal-binding protein
MVFCKECNNYNSLWSCPPLEIDVNQFLLDYNYIYVIGVKIIYDAETIKSAKTPEKIKEITMHSLKEVKSKLSDTLLALERQIPASVSLASGGCHLCQRCKRCDKLPCEHPEKMRYSLDAFGFDLTAITSDLLQIDLKWSKDTLPEYYTLIHALLTKHSLSNMLENIKI